MEIADKGVRTIHQPSAVLFETFDRLLFLAEGGKTVYFGDIGDQAATLLDYFKRHGARDCEDLENPAEYILEMVANDGCPGVDWPAEWHESIEYQQVLTELDSIAKGSPDAIVTDDDNAEFATTLFRQLLVVLGRAFQSYFRQPDYIYAKFTLSIAAGLFIGFSFWKADNSQQGFQNVLFSVFLLCTIFNTLVNQIMPKFVAQRSLYEVRERPSRTYSWKVFILSQILVEVPWQVCMGVCSWASFYWSVFGPNQTSDRRVLVLLFIVQFFIYAGSMAQLVVASAPESSLAALLATLMFGLSFVFSGVMQPPGDLPRFWIFMYRVSPFTYYIGGISSTALHGRPVRCNSAELNTFDPPVGQTCYQYLEKYLEVAPGTIYNPNATANCEYCGMKYADQYLGAREIYWEDRWRNYGIFWCYFVFNIFGAIALYYLFRVRSWRRKTGKGKKSA